MGLLPIPAPKLTPESCVCHSLTNLWNELT